MHEHKSGLALLFKKDNPAITYGHLHLLTTLKQSRFDRSDTEKFGTDLEAKFWGFILTSHQRYNTGQGFSINFFLRGSK